MVNGSILISVQASGYRHESGVSNLTLHREKREARTDSTDYKALISPKQ